MITESISKGNVTVKLEADIDLEKLMEQLPAEIAMRASRKAVKKGADVGNRDYKARVPVGKTGNLKASIMTGGKVIVKKRKGKGYVGFVGATRPMGAHSHLLEHGWNVKPRGRGKKAQERTNERIGRMAANLFGDGITAHQTRTILKRISDITPNRRNKPLTGKAKVPGKGYLLATFKATREKSQRAIINSLQDDIIKAGG